MLFNCSGELCADADPRMALVVSSADMTMTAIITKVLVANNQMSAMDARSLKLGAGWSVQYFPGWVK